MFIIQFQLVLPKIAQNGEKICPLLVSSEHFKQKIFNDL